MVMSNTTGEDRTERRAVSGGGVSGSGVRSLIGWGLIAGIGGLRGWGVLLPAQERIARHEAAVEAARTARDAAQVTHDRLTAEAEALEAAVTIELLLRRDHGWRRDSDR